MKRRTIRTKSLEIGGFSDGYEAACQRMLMAGLVFMKKNPDKEYDFKQLRNVYGLIVPEGKNAEELEDAVMEPVPDCTGAMVQTVINNLLYIKKNGYQKWLEYDPSRVIEVDDKTGFPVKEQTK